MQLEYKFCGLRRTGEQIPGIVALVPQWFISAPLITLKLMGPRGLAVAGGAGIKMHQERISDFTALPLNGMKS